MAIGSSIYPISASAIQTRQQTNPAIRIRRSTADPLSPSELAEKRREVVDKASDTRTMDDSPTPRRSPIRLEDHEYIVAYNLDIIDGAPSEWVGIAEMASEQSNDGVARVASSRDIVANIHSQAKQNAQGRKYLKQQNEADILTLSSEDSDKWSDWDRLLENEWHKQDDHGNKTAWTVQWKADPADSQKHAVHAELRMYPYHSGTAPWDNEGAKINFEFNDCVEVESHEPGNSIGSNTKSWSLGYSSGGEVSIGIGGATTSSNLDIDDTTVIDGNENHVTHTYTFNGDLEGNSLFLPASATAVSEWNSGEKFVEVDLVSRYWQWWRGPHTLSNSYEYYWR